MTTTAGFTTMDEALAYVHGVTSNLHGLLGGHFWKLTAEEQLALAEQVETASRLLYAAQVHAAGELDSQGAAGRLGSSSTAALLRGRLRISPAEAFGRVNTARVILPRETLTGDELDPVLPVLADAVNTGRVSAEQIRIIRDTIKKVPSLCSEQVRAEAEALLVDEADRHDPKTLEKIARKLLDTPNPDGKLDDTTPASKMELNFGTRHINTGLTPVKGLLDDDAVEVISKALDGLSKPQPSSDGTPDPRPAANRRAHALVGVARGFLDAGAGPTQGGEKPHLSITLNWDSLSGQIRDAHFDTGAALSPAQARRYLCDAQVIPAVLGGNSEVLDVGRSMRTFPVAIRRAVTLRDRGCVWDGCDRPAAWCDGHHVAFWQRDFGDTSYQNAVLLCPHHHTKIHQGEWEIRFAPDGIPELIPPSWLDPDQKPRRNPMHRLPETVSRR